MLVLRTRYYWFLLCTYGYILAPLVLGGSQDQTRLTPGLVNDQVAVGLLLEADHGQHELVLGRYLVSCVLMRISPVESQDQTKYL